MTASTILEAIQELLSYLLFFISSFFQESIQLGTNSVLLQEQIAEGGYAFVYRACDSQRRRYAVKKLIIQSFESEVAARKEVECLRRYRHHSIVDLIDSVVKDDGNGSGKFYFLLFPYMKNGSLRQRLDKILSGAIKHPDLREILKNFQCICEALNCLHKSDPSYVHNDVKPDNILIGDDGRVYLTDFGSAAPADRVIETRADSINVAEHAARVCTISYRAPELFDPPKGCILDSRTDVWSLGCLLFAWKFGFSPFECEFTDSSSGVRLVESSYSRVLAKWPRPKKPTMDESTVIGICEWVLNMNINDRPYVSDIISRVLMVSSSNGDINIV